MNAQQLKSSILQFAMQGGLVEQIPSEEPVKDLLEKIRREKDQLIKGKKIKKEQPHPPITPEEILFDTPETWQWVRISEISTYIQRGKSPKYSDEEKIPVISQKCVQWSGFNILPAKFIDPESLDKYEEIRFLQDGDILWNSTGLGTVGRVAIYEKKRNPFLCAVADSHVTILRCSKNISYEYVNYYLSSFYIQSRILELTSGTTKQRELNTSTVKNILIPLPPVEEQQRIVSKIKVLEREIDRYSELYELNKSIETKFPINIEKSLLQYAMKGKLVDQDPNNEPAAKLVKQIHEEKSRLVLEKVIRKEKPLPPINEDEVPFGIPESWEWVRLGEVINLVSGQDFPPDKYNHSGIGTPYITGASTLTNEGVLLNRWTETPRSIAEIGDLLLVCKGSGYGKTLICNLEVAHIARQIMAIKKSVYLNMEFIELYLLSNLSLIKKLGQGVIPGIDRKSILNLLLPLPPLKEQTRIVEKMKENYDLLNKIQLN